LVLLARSGQPNLRSPYDHLVEKTSCRSEFDGSLLLVTAGEHGAVEVRHEQCLTGREMQRLH
jgi:hypothetical protein